MDKIEQAKLQNSPVELDAIAKVTALAQVSQNYRNLYFDLVRKQKGFDKEREATKKQLLDQGYVIEQRDQDLEKVSTKNKKFDDVLYYLLGAGKTAVDQVLRGDFNTLHVADMIRDHLYDKFARSVAMQTIDSSRERKENVMTSTPPKVEVDAKYDSNPYRIKGLLEHEEIKALLSQKVHEFNDYNEPSQQRILDDPQHSFWRTYPS